MDDDIFEELAEWLNNTPKPDANNDDLFMFGEDKLIEPDPQKNPSLE